jgi:MFS family permease
MVGQSEFSRAWTVVLAAFVGMMLGISAIPFFTLGAFAGPVTGEMGWSMAQFQGAFTVITIGSLFGPLVGHLCDQRGVRPIALISCLLFGLALMGIGVFTGPSVISFYAAWAVMAIVGQGTGPIAWTRIINGWFFEQRGLALGLALTGSGLFAFFGPLLTTRMIDSMGWRTTYIVWGFVVLLVALPVLWRLLRDAPRDLHATTAGAGADVGLSLGQALRGYRFWVIAIAFLLISFGVSGIIANLIPLLGTKNIDRETAAKFAAIIGVSIVVGRVLVGLLLDRFWGPGVAFVLLALPAISCLVLAGGLTGTLPIAAAIFIVGFAAGAEFDIIAYFTARYFGLKSYGKIYGLQYIAFAVGAAAAPPMFGRVFDITNSYDQILTVVAVIFVAASALLLSLGRYPASFAAER